MATKVTGSMHECWRSSCAPTNSCRSSPGPIPEFNLHGGQAPFRTPALILKRRPFRRPRLLKDTNGAFTLGRDQSTRGNRAWFKAGADQDGSPLGGIGHQEHGSGNPVGNCSLIGESLDMLHAPVVSRDFTQPLRPRAWDVNLIESVQWLTSCPVRYLRDIRRAKRFAVRRKDLRQFLERHGAPG